MLPLINQRLVHSLNSHWHHLLDTLCREYRMSKESKHHRLLYSMEHNHIAITIDHILKRGLYHSRDKRRGWLLGQAQQRSQSDLHNFLHIPYPGELGLWI